MHWVNLPAQAEMKTVEITMMTPLKMPLKTSSTVTGKAMDLSCIGLDAESGPRTPRASSSWGQPLWQLPRVVPLLALLALGACTHVEEIDFGAERAEQAQKDLADLTPANEVVFDQPLSLDEVIAIGLKNNLDLRVSAFEKELASEDAYKEKLALLPDLDFGANYSQRDSDLVSNTRDVLTRAETNVSTTTQARENTTLNLTLTWNVLDFGISYIRARQAQLQVEILKNRRKRQKQTLALDITESFWKAALAEDALDYVREVRRELDAQREAIQRSVDERRLEPIAAKEVEKKLVDIALSIRDLQADIAGSRLELSRLMGLRQDQSYSLRREAIKPVLAQLPKPEDIDSHLLEIYAVENRPELYERDINLKIQSDEARAMLISMFPNLALTLGSSYDKNTLLRNQAWSSVGVNLGWNLLSLPSKFAAYESGKKGVAVARAQRLQITVGVLAQVHIAILDYGIAVDRFRLREESYRLTRDLLEMSRERFLAGKLSNLAVTQRLLEDMSVKLQRDQSVVDLIVAHRRLLTSIGADPLIWREPMASILSETSFAETVPAVVEDQAEQSESANLDLQLPGASDQELEQAQSEELADYTAVDDTDEEGASALPSAEAARKAWAVQVGVYRSMASLRDVLANAKKLAVNSEGEQFDTSIDEVDAGLVRGRVVQLSRNEARTLCTAMSGQGMECMVVPPGL